MGEHAITTPPVEFDFSKLDSELGWSEKDNPLIGLGVRSQRIALAGEFMGEILAWLASATTVKRAGVKAFVLIWMVRPSLMMDHQSLASFARACGVPRQDLNRYMSQLRTMSRRKFKHGLMRSEAATKSMAVSYKQKHSDRM